MQFSSSSSAKPTIFDGLEGLSQYYTRCTERISTFEKYEQSGVFPPSSFRMSNFFLFTKLQLPPSTEIDAMDFLNGAQFACDLAMHTMYSREFINFACGAISESKAANHLKRGLSAESYDAFLFAMNETSKSGNTFDLTQLDINGVFLVGVDWERLTLADYKAEQLVATPSQAEPTEGEAAGAAKVSKIETTEEPEEIVPADHQTVVERMRLDVLFETKEHLDVQTSDGQDQTIARESSAVWRFESLVTTPDDIDWKIVSVV
ncbi:hypothetical protein Gpo141_00010435 [Globisporangium polare]